MLRYGLEFRAHPHSQQFTVRYQAVVFRPFRNEVVDAIVTQVDGMGLRGQVGAMSVFIYKDVP